MSNRTVTLDHRCLVRIIVVVSLLSISLTSVLAHNARDEVSTCPDQADPVCALRTPPPVDSDGDGTPDVDDSCPDDPGPEYNDGCPLIYEPLDSDGDGIPDFDDSCPEVWGPAFKNGCPLRFPDFIPGVGR